MRVEFEMFTEEDDGAIVLQKLSELAMKAKDLGFVVSEVEMEAVVVDVGEELEENEDEESEDEDEEEENARYQ